LRPTPPAGGRRNGENRVGGPVELDRVGEKT
jgi:hypothetical protein